MNFRSPALFGAVFSIFAASYPLHSQADTSPLESLLPDVPYQRKAGRTYIFSRAQFKYRLTADDHLNRYVDRPLFLSPAHDVYQKHFEQAAALAQQYGLDGLAFFPGNGFSQETYSFAYHQPETFRLLTEIYPGKNPLPFVAAALPLKNSMRIDDKLLISTYHASSVSVAKWSKLVEEIRTQFPDKTVIVPDLNNFGGIPLGGWNSRFTKGELNAVEVEKAKEHVRYWLRSSDGVYYSSGEILRKSDRTYYRDFYEQFIIRLFKSVLSEDEFQGKLLGLVANLGHENHTRMGLTLNSNGTRTLRDSMEAALSATPDFINLPEWDELNESTCIMPTVFDGRSTMRIMRYYTAKARGATPEPIPGDDLSTPNLILSYRKLLTAGEKLEFELLNVPDSAADAAYTAKLVLKGKSGKEVYRSESFAFRRDELREHRVTLPSESLLKDQLLLPELEIVEEGKVTSLADGLHAVHLRATWNWDHKWVKQPVRELLRPDEITFDILPDSRAPELFKVSASVKVDEPLAVFELLENDNPIYIHAAKDGDRWRDNAAHAVLSFAWKAEQGFAKPLKLEGSVELKGAEGKWLRMRHPGENGVDASAVQGQKLVLDGQRGNIWQRRVLLSIPMDQVPDAVLVVALQGGAPREIRVTDLLRRGAYGVAGEESLHLLISRFTRQLQFPESLGSKEAEFEVDIWPESYDAVYQVRAIGESGRIYRSKPVVLKELDGGEAEVAFLSATKEAPARAKVAAERVPDLRYEFSPERGDLLATSAGRMFWGVNGGFSTLITERGASPGDGSTFMGDAFAATAFSGKASAPKWVALKEGGYALEFNGEASYVTLPQGVIPRRSGYTITMEIRPEEKEGIQPLLANYASRFGTLAVYLEKGELKADFLADVQVGGLKPVKGIASGIAIPVGEWSVVTIRYDQAQITLAAGDKTYTQPLPGPGAHDVVTALGVYQKQWFKGQMKALRIEHLP